MINAPMLKSILIGAALLTTASTVAAQAYPTRPVRFVVPYAPGGSTDTLARSIATVLADQLGQQVVVDNRTGANGDIGMTIVAKAPADGYTVVLGYIANIGIGPSLYEKMPYDPVKDFAPITLSPIPRCRRRTSRSSSPTPRPIRKKSVSPPPVLPVSAT